VCWILTSANICFIDANQGTKSRFIVDLDVAEIVLTSVSSQWTKYSGEHKREDGSIRTVYTCRGNRKDSKNYRPAYKAAQKKYGFPQRSPFHAGFKPIFFHRLIHESTAAQKAAGKRASRDADDEDIQHAQLTNEERTVLAKECVDQQAAKKQKVDAKRAAQNAAALLGSVQP